MENKSAIQTVLVIPRNKSYSSYFINGNPEEHAMKYQDLQEYLIDLVPQRAGKIVELVRSFAQFIVFVEFQEVEKLTPDTDLEAKKMQLKQERSLGKNLKQKKSRYEKSKERKNSFNQKAEKLYRKLSQNK